MVRPDAVSRDPDAATIPRAYRQFTLGTGLWFGGWGMLQVLFSWLVVGELRAREELVGVAQLALVLPALLFLLLGGAVADRLDRRRLLVVEDNSTLREVLSKMASDMGMSVETVSDGPGALRRFLIRNLVMEGHTLDSVLNDEEEAEAFIRKAAIGVWHASCTCRMGRADDSMSVVDTVGRGHGTAGLRVVDASIFPVVPCATTNLPTIMTAEKIADAILDGR